jgi:serine/threonine-protein kinase RsbW
MPPDTRMRLPARLESLEPARRALADFVQALGFDPTSLAHLELALEEIVVNICTYAYPGGAGEMEIAWEAIDGGVRLEIVDWGAAFDPTAAPDPARPVDVGEQPIGGLGVYLLKQLMDEVRYRREAGRNHLTIIKRKAAGSGAESGSEGPPRGL